VDENGNAKGIDLNVNAEGLSEAETSLSAI
jgi:hypothetical protein